MELLLSLILQIVDAGDGLSEAIMGKSLKAVIQEHVVCKRHFEQREEDFRAAMRIENPTVRAYALDALRRRVLEQCGVRP
ncbi:hypothetical protein [Nitrospira moscoviensis]|uniref:Uncharacterized protein n=1 Tax=Nitrospira moscoviensis TaxID=42253 RepID=A0A0K2GGA0_NITMO|nr:hypothetical protein [Nitrospira moscoviensis]ALA59978.1 hypothetical protein NITMOv2_3586 [Nitrospira moscoviensis]